MIAIAAAVLAVCWTTAALLVGWWLGSGRRR
jgi:hypothetical protein